MTDSKFYHDFALIYKKTQKEYLKCCLEHFSLSFAAENHIICKLAPYIRSCQIKCSAYFKGSSLYSSLQILFPSGNFGSFKFKFMATLYTFFQCLFIYELFSCIKTSFSVLKNSQQKLKPGCLQWNLIRIIIYPEHDYPEYYYPKYDYPKYDYPKYDYPEYDLSLIHI